MVHIYIIYVAHLEVPVPNSVRWGKVVVNDVDLKSVLVSQRLRAVQVIAATAVASIGDAVNDQA